MLYKAAMSMHKRIKAAMAAKGLIQDDIADKMGITQQAVSQWLKSKEEGGTSPRGKRLSLLASILDRSVDWLVSGDDHRSPVLVSVPKQNENVYPIDKVGKIPLISWVSAGMWCEAIDNYSPGDAESWLNCPVDHGKHTYALRVSGDSMTSPYPGQRSYPNGTIIFVDPETELTNGCRVIAKLPSTQEVTFKEYYYDAGMHYLKPINPQYPTISLIDKTIICGVVIGSFIKD